MGITRFLNKSALVRLTAVTAFFAALACGGAAPQPEEKPPAAPVKLINGVGRMDACRAVAAKLELDAAPPVEAYRDGDGRLDYSQPTTTILCGEPFTAQAQALRARLGFGEVVAAPGLEAVEIIVARDAFDGVIKGAPATGVYVSKGDRAVYYYEGGELTQVWPCAIGKPETPTPEGRFEVTVTLKDPTWYWQGKAIPPGPENGLGEWFIGINKRGYGLHGTNEPPSIGGAVSHGCIRMYNEDAAVLTALVEAGTPVVIGK
jgi:lipoprotein-anchoring transpeptidase ErfK/SrfK